MIIDRVLATWLQVAYADGRMAQSEGIDRAGLEFLARRQQQAQRQHLAAIQAWRQWRRLADEWVSPPETVTNDNRQISPEQAGEEPCILPFSRRATA